MNIRSCLDDANSSTFVRAEVRGEMKKSVTYGVNMRLSADVFFFSEAKCECTAEIGQLAHCKHICAVICDLLNFDKKR